MEQGECSHRPEDNEASDFVSTPWCLLCSGGGSIPNVPARRSSTDDSDFTTPPPQAPCSSSPPGPESPPDDSDFPKEGSGRRRKKQKLLQIVGLTTGHLAIQSGRQRMLRLPMGLK